MISILGLEISNFVRTVAMVCASKQQAYQISWTLGDETIDFRSETHRKYHGFAKFPVIRDEQITLAETLAICRYLDAKYPDTPLQPVGLLERAQHDAWCSMAITQIDQALMRQFIVELAFPTGKDGKPDMQKLHANKPAALHAIAVIERQLVASEYDFICTPDFSIADALLGPILDYVANLKAPLLLLEEDSPVHAYLDRIRQQPGARDILR